MPFVIEYENDISWWRKSVNLLPTTPTAWRRYAWPEPAPGSVMLARSAQPRHENFLALFLSVSTWLVAGAMGAMALAGVIYAWRTRRNSSITRL